MRHQMERQGLSGLAPREVAGEGRQEEGRGGLLLLLLLLPLSRHDSIGGQPCLDPACQRLDTAGGVVGGASASPHVEDEHGLCACVRVCV